MRMTDVGLCEISLVRSKVELVLVVLMESSEAADLESTHDVCPSCPVEVWSFVSRHIRMWCEYCVVVLLVDTHRCSFAVARRMMCYCIVVPKADREVD